MTAHTKGFNTADDFLVGVIGSHEDAQRVKADVKEFLKNELKLEMSVEKTKITHRYHKARFLSYDITISKSEQIKKDRRGQMRKCCSHTVCLYVPHEKWVSKLLDYGAISIRAGENGNEKWLTLHRGRLINRPDIEILSKVNSEIRGMYNYYCIANNATVIKNFAHNMEYSMYKTFGRKYRCSVKKIIAKYSRDGKFLIPNETQKGRKYCELYNGGFKRKKSAVRFDSDPLPQYAKYDRPNQLRARLKAGVCELCGMDTDDVRIHHARKLKDLTGNTPWEQIMLAKRRKTLAVCPKCHAKTHQ